MPPFLLTVYILSSTVTLVAVVASSLLSPKPKTIQQHMFGIGRLGVLAGVSMKAAGFLQTGVDPGWEWLLITLSLAMVYVAQVKCEVIRQKLRRRGHAI